MTQRLWIRLVPALVCAALVATSSPVTAAPPAMSPTSSDTDTDKPADTDEAVDSATARAVAKAWDHRVEDVSQRTETTQVFVNPDGSWTSEQTTGPVRALDDDGNWADINTDLVPVEGGFAPKNVPGDLVLSDGGEKSFATLNVDGRELAWQWRATLPTPVIDGSTATYADVVPGGDLVVTVTPSGFQHDIVLREAPAEPVSYEIPLVTNGPSVEGDADGSLTIETRGGDQLAEASAPVMYDAERHGAGQPDAAVPVDSSVRETANGALLTLSPDQDFLTDPDTTYPVTIDPLVTYFPVQDTWVDSATPTVGNPASTELRAGTPDNGVNKYRSFMSFENGAWYGHEIVSATLKLNNFSSSACTGETRAYRLIGPGWGASNVTWNAQPTATFDNSSPNNSGRGFTGCAAGDLDYDVTDIVAGWSSDTWHNYGFRVGATVGPPHFGPDLVRIHPQVRGPV